MNRPIRRVALVAMIMFGLLLANGTFLTIFREPSLTADPANRRVRDAEFGQDRGSILAGSTEIARTVPSKDRFRYQRTYPDGSLYADLTGFYSYDHGRTGLESSYNTQLAGTDDALFVRRMVDLVTDRTPQGASVQTTVEPAMQEAAAKAFGDQKGAVVALDAQTGAVLAMVTSPTYDPDTIASHQIDQAATAYKKLLADDDDPLTNRAVREIYPPGSTFKLVTAAAALEHGQTPESEVKSPTVLRLPGTTTDLPNDTDCGGAEITIARALAVSCNTAFANLGLGLGDDALREQAAKFGFDQRHLDDLAGAASQFPDDLDPSQLALSSIGQYDVAASPLQMAMVTAGIANDGVVMDPFVVQSVKAPDLKPIQTHRPTELSTAMSAEHARQLQEMMVGVVTDGTGANGAISGVRVGGKTGTAQGDLAQKPYAWFTAFADTSDRADGRKIAVAVMVQDADIPRQDIAGGRVAAPIARAVLEAGL